MQPRDSTELRSFLENIGLTIDEFQEMRREEQQPPAPESSIPSRGIRILRTYAFPANTYLGFRLFRAGSREHSIVEIGNVLIRSS